MLLHVPHARFPDRWFAYPVRLGLEVSRGVMRELLEELRGSIGEDIVQQVVKMLSLHEIEEVRGAFARLPLSFDSSAPPASFAP
jgi:hypothetical protein